MKIFSAFLSALALALALVSGPASAEAQVKTAKGETNLVKQFTVNDFTVYAILDQESSLPAELFSGPLTKEQRLAFLPGGQAKGSVNVYLINGPAGNIMVDAGWGGSGPGREVLVGRLKEIGLSPEDIDLVILTHMHPDHIGGLVDGSQAVFAKAKILVSGPELEYWSGLIAPKATQPEPEPSPAPAPEQPASPEAEPEPVADTDDWAQKPLAPGASADQADEEAEPAAGKFAVAPDDLPRAVIEVYGPRLTTFDFDQEISPGLTAMSAVGHTPGHTAFLLKSGEHQLLFIGDLLHSAALQFPEPEEYVSYDIDPAQAVATRKAVLQMAADRNLPVAGAHIPFPGLGEVKADGKNGFAFTPVTADEQASGQWEFTMGSMF